MRQSENCVLRNVSSVLSIYVLELCPRLDRRILSAHACVKYRHGYLHIEDIASITDIITISHACASCRDLSKSA